MKKPFHSGVLLVYLKDAKDEFRGGVSICDPIFQKIEGRDFLVGTVPNVVNDWSCGQQIGIAFDQVVHFLGFNNETEFTDKLALIMTQDKTSKPIQ